MDAGILGKPYTTWTLEEAVEVLNQSPWARQETFTRVIGGIGSGILGEKEIYSTFFVRFLSARPVRQAYARVKQIKAGYDQMDRAAKRKFDAALNPGLKMDVSNWIVVAVRKPRRPRFTPRIGMSSGESTRAARSTVPSPPNTHATPAPDMPIGSA